MLRNWWLHYFIFCHSTFLSILNRKMERVTWAILLRNPFSWETVQGWPGSHRPSFAATCFLCTHQRAFTWPVFLISKKCTRNTLILNGKNWCLPEQSEKQILVNYYISINPVQQRRCAESSWRYNNDRIKAKIYWGLSVDQA